MEGPLDQNGMATGPCTNNVNLGGRSFLDIKD